MVEAGRGRGVGGEDGREQVGKCPDEEAKRWHLPTGAGWE